MHKLFVLPNLSSETEIFLSSASCCFCWIVANLLKPAQKLWLTSPCIFFSLSGQSNIGHLMEWQDQLTRNNYFWEFSLISGPQKRKCVCHPDWHGTNKYSKTSSMDCLFPRFSLWRRRSRVLWEWDRKDLFLFLVSRQNNRKHPEVEMETINHSHCVIGWTITLIGCDFWTKIASPPQATTDWPTIIPSLLFMELESANEFNWWRRWSTIWIFKCIKLTWMAKTWGGGWL